MNRTIKEKDYNIFGIIKMAKAHAHGATLDHDKRMREFYNLIASDEDRKVFYFADTTMARVKKMDISKLNAEDILPICHKSDNRTGIILTSGNHARLCFGYTISDTQIIISAFTNNRSSRHSENPDAVLKSMWVGNIIISTAGVEINPCSLLAAIMMTSEGVTPKLDKADGPILKRILREVERVPDAFADASAPGKICFSPGRLINDERVPATRAEAIAYCAKYDTLRLVLRMFLFLKTASVIQQTYISEGPANSYQRGQKTIRDYILVDSTWDGEISVLNPFPVRGHFRRQPKKDKDGNWYRDLIYIDAFMKSGYHRKAKITTE